MIKTEKIKLPFGLNENNIIVHITNVEGGEECNCICLDCKMPLIAVKGRIKQHHFRHKNINECKGGLESSIHLAAKQMIMEKKKITLPTYVCTAFASDSRGLKHTEDEIFLRNSKIIYFDSVEKEKKLHGMKADLVAHKEGIPLIIEIFYSHKVDDQKIAKIKNANISAIEINLSELKQKDVKNPEAFWCYINNSNHVQWLYNAKANERLYPKLVTRLSVKIQGREKKYYEHKEQAKLELAQALKIFKMLRNKRYIPLSSKRLKLNPVWEMYGENYYTFNELPHFLNLYVPDGDWIFCCDRRIWQAIIYDSFICNNYREPFFFIWEVVSQITVQCGEHRCVKRIRELSQYYPDLVPPEFLDYMPSYSITLQAYFNHLCELGMLEFTVDDRQHVQNMRYKIISITPTTTLEV
ncbi:competence protein CoiA family protein [Legionella maioricensis]|uniref:Competence protein CoiA-like family protein n=1 Tax=Legionella maioricensis TaxID=2896528 RepID=A0A9X2D399_9GAMM|nr:competence protein CoiA family protein [Legionella maioricensis]MCL9685721.1 hypothetical protein [Legionella maioricensis]MCL9688991.1 hypothetical protein [Legionella maioricensis]